MCTKNTNGFGIWMWILVALVLMPGGCRKPDKKKEPVYLIRVGSSITTTDAFQKSLELAKTAYPFDNDQGNDPGDDIENEPIEAMTSEDKEEGESFRDVQLQMLKLRLLKQITERMILVERAKELQVTVTEKEIRSEIERIRKDYPDDEFEQMFLKAAVSFDAWKQELKIRLLMEKVIETELGGKIVVTQEEITMFIKKLTGNSGEKGNGKNRRSKKKRKEPKHDRQMIMKHLRQMKIEAEYQPWMEKMKQHFTIQVDREQWESVSVN